MNAIKQFRQMFFRKLGTCGLCMRLNFRFALGCWLALLAMMYFGVEREYLFLPLPLGFTTLWMLHVTTFATSVVNAMRHGGHHVDSPRMNMTRRFLIFRGMRAAAAAILVSTAIPELAAAQSGCGSGWHQCAGTSKCRRDGFNYFCVSNQCDGHTNWCYVAKSDEDYKWLLGCCGGMVSC